MRPCLDCGRHTDRSRCPAHRRVQERARKARRKARRPTADTYAERQRRARTVASFIEAHGYVCPGCPVSDGRPHPADPERNPLTADHYLAVGAGGPEDGPLRVLCRRGNSARGARA